MESVNTSVASPGFLQIAQSHTVTVISTVARGVIEMVYYLAMTALKVLAAFPFYYLSPTFFMLGTTLGIIKANAMKEACNNICSFLWKERGYCIGLPIIAYVAGLANPISLPIACFFAGGAASSFNKE